MNYFEWETNEYPKIFAKAKQIGYEAYKNGLPRICNLGDEFRHNGVVLKVWLSAWEQGYDGYDPIPPIFKQMEEHLKNAPIEPLDQNDL